MRLALVVICVAACGRVAFDPIAPASDGGSPDASTPFTCPPVAPQATVTISGETFRYTSFTNQTAAVAGTVVTVSGAGGASLAQTTSNASGVYAVSVPSGGGNPIASISYVAATYEPTVLFFDQPVDRDLAGTGAAVWAPGDGPVWNDAATNMVYAAASLTRDPTRGTINIAVYDCAGAAIEGVAVAIDPAPAAMRYQAAGGTPDPALTSTIAPFGHVLGFNADAGAAHVTASKPGLRFSDLSLVVTAGGNALGILRGGP